MPKDFLISAGIVLAGRTAFQAAVGGSIRRIDSLGKEIEQLNARAKRIRAVQALTSEVSRTEVAAREARTRAEHLGRAFAATARPTRTLRQHLESARREADRLSDSLDEQRRRLGEQQTAMRQAGDSVAGFARIQKRLSDARAERGHLTGLVGQREKARTDRVQARGDLVEAAGVAYAVARPLMGAMPPRASSPPWPTWPRWWTSPHPKRSS